MAIWILVFEVLLFCRYVAVVGHGWDCQAAVRGTYASVGIAVSVTQNNMHLLINIGEIKCA
jgi:hypothetical protein